MKIDFDNDRLLELLKSFHMLTGFRVVLFDDEYQLLLSWPEKDCTFCKCMKEHGESGKYCKESDEYSFRTSREKKKLVVYQCHAGLVEATVPLIENHVVIGYLMFGQISKETTDTILRNHVLEAFERYHLRSEGRKGFSDSWQWEQYVDSLCREIPMKTEPEIASAAKILEACTFYAIYDEIVMLRRQKFAENLKAYLLNHLSETLDADSIARNLGISRSKLYTSCDKYLGMGIAEYVRDTRIDYAKQLLKTTEMTISEISDTIGFSDYAYFSRVFKKKTGTSPKKYRSMD